MDRFTNQVPVMERQGKHTKLLRIRLTRSRNSAHSGRGCNTTPFSPSPCSSPRGRPVDTISPHKLHKFLVRAHVRGSPRKIFTHLPIPHLILCYVIFAQLLLIPCLRLPYNPTLLQTEFFPHNSNSIEIQCSPSHVLSR